MPRQTKTLTKFRTILCVSVFAFAAYVPQNLHAQDAVTPATTEADNFDFLTGEPSEPPVDQDFVVEDVTQTAVTPDVEVLAPPKVQTEAQVQEINIPDIPTIAAPEEFDDNLFFDADDIVPDTEMGKKSGPRKVNPSAEPASKLILVRKNAHANSTDAQIVAAQRALGLGRYDAALEMYNRLAEKRKRNPNVLLGRATALQKLGRDQEAITAYQKLLDLRPGNLDAEINMLGLMSETYPAVALQRLLELREKHDDNVGIVAQIAVVQAALRRYNDALQYLGIATSMEPENASHLFNIAIVADQAGNTKEAVKYYEQALEVDTIYGGGRTIPRDVVYERLAQIR